MPLSKANPPLLLWWLLCGQRYESICSCSWLWLQVILWMWSREITKKELCVFSKTLSGWKKFKHYNLTVGLTEPFTQIPSEAFAHRVKSDHPAGRTVACLLSIRTTRQPFPHYLYLESHTLVSTHFWVRWKLWQRSYSVTRGPVARTCCPGKAVWGEEAEVWSAAVIPLGGMTPFSLPGPMWWPVWLVPLAKGQPAAVRGHRRAEDKTGIRCILAHH